MDASTHPLDRLRALFPKADLEYVRALITTLILLLLLPWALIAFLRHPADIADQGLRNHGLGV